MLCSVNNKTDPDIMSIISASLPDCTAANLRNVDYQQQRQLLTRIADLLRTSGVETAFCHQSLAYHRRQRRTPLTVEEETRFLDLSRVALRCHLLRHHLGDSLRRFSRDLPAHEVWREFCQVTPETAPSKSTLFRFGRWLPEAEVRLLAQELNRTASRPRAEGTPPLGLAEPVALSVASGDSTALVTPIHPPADWMLIRDGIRTLILAILCIRRAGLFCRMPKPQQFLTGINRLCIALTQASRAQSTSSSCQSKHKRHRKIIIRRMLRQLKIVEAHARRHLARLQQAWEQTPLSMHEAMWIAGRITNVLNHLDQVRTQVKTRLLREEPVPNADKLLSLYRPTTCVLMRGKTGQRVEYGHYLWVQEQWPNGLILDWAVVREPTTDPTQARASLERLRTIYAEAVHAEVGDRGCDGPEMRADLETASVFNAIAARSPRELQLQSADPRFRALQRRRGCTEGRIGVLKAGTLRVAKRARSDLAEDGEVTWGMLTHNLWVLARLPQADTPAQAA